MMKSPLDNQRGQLLLWSLCVAVLVTGLMGAALIRSDSQLTQADWGRARVEAFYAAEAGLQFAVFEIRKDSYADWIMLGYHNAIKISDVNGQEVGRFLISAKEGGPWSSYDRTLWVRSYGRDSSGKTSMTIYARVSVENISDFMVSTVGDLRIQGGSQFDADIFARDLYFDGSPIQINASASYTGNYYGNLAGVTFGPSGLLVQADPKTFSGINFGRYLELAQLLGPFGQAQILSDGSTLNLNSLDPLVSLVVIEGDVIIHGTFPQSVLVVAQNNIIINGDIVPQCQGSSCPQIGLLATDDIIIPANFSGDMTITNALLMADGQSVDSLGGVIKTQTGGSSKGDLTFSGSISVRGDKKNLDDGTARSVIDFSPFSSRTYDFSNDFITNPTIPHMPSMADIRTWQTTPPPNITFVPATTQLDTFIYHFSCQDLSEL